MVAFSLNAGTRKETVGTRGVYGRAGAGPAGVAIVAVAAVIIGLVVRGWVLAGPLGTLDSDEAISGLIARHILDGEVAALFWLGNYGGTLESAVAAVVFALVGSSTIALKLTTVALFLLASVLTWRVGLRTVGPRAALAGAALFWVAPAYFLWWSTKARGFYAMGLVLGLLAFLFVLRLRERGSRRDVAALGLVLGLGWWTTPGVLILALPALGWLVWRRPSIMRLAPLALPGVVVGAAPWLAWNVRNGWLSLELSPVASGRSTFVDRLADLSEFVFPTWLGVRVPFSLDWLLGAFVGWAVVAVAFGGFAVLLARRRPQHEPLLVTAAVFPLLYGLSKFTYYIDEPRYVVYVSPALALLAGTALVTPARAAVAVAAALALAVGGLAQMERDGLFHPIAQDVRVPSELGGVIDLLEREGQTRVLANYWIAYRISFESGERIIATSTGFVRYEPHDELVRRSAYPARVYVGGSAVERRARADLATRGYRRVETDGFVVYVHDRARLP